MSTNIDQIPDSDMTDIKNRPINQIRDMDDAELQTLTRTRESLGYFIAGAVQAIAKVLGYIIALPIAWAMRWIESISHGFEEGWTSALKSAWLLKKHTSYDCMKTEMNR